MADDASAAFSFLFLKSKNATMPPITAIPPTPPTTPPTIAPTLVPPERVFPPAAFEVEVDEEWDDTEDEVEMVETFSGRPPTS